jgi:hypothetical protein
MEITKTSNDVGKTLPITRSQSPPVKEGIDQGKKVTVTVVPSDSPLGNKTVSMGHGKKNLEQIGHQSLERMSFKSRLVLFGKKTVINIFKGVINLQKSISSLGVKLSMGISGIKDITSGNLERARKNAQELRDTLGRPMKHNILSQTIPTKNFGNVKVLQVMEQYRRDMGEPVTREQMVRYINMGERIVQAITQGKFKDGKLELMVDGKKMTVKSNLDVTRAISWYLNAKGVMDNAAADLDPIVIKGGSMVLKDPENRLYKFLNSAPNTYNRVSSHFMERSSSPKAKKGFFGFFGGMFKKQPSQRGIEDFSNKMPSGKGCLLFDKMTGKDGALQIFLKWESVGTPTVYGPSVHGDEEDGTAKQIWNKYTSFDRCLQHARNFLKVGGHGKNESWGMHRESIHKPGAGKTMVYDPFLNLLDSLEKNKMPPSRDEALMKQMRKEAKKFGLDKIEEHFQTIQSYYKDIPFTKTSEKNVENQIKNLKTNISEFKSMMGTDHGISRKGSELHVTLNTDYLK